MGALRVAPSRSPWAWVTASWSCRMATSSAATRVAELLPPPAALPEPPVLRVALVATPADEAAEEGAPPLEPADDAADEAADEPEGCADELDPEDVAVAACMITVNSWAICVARPVSAVSAACWVLEADAIAVAQVRSWSALGVVLPWPGAGLVGEPVGFGVSVGVPVGGTVGVPVGGTVGVPVGGTVGVPVGGTVGVPEGTPVVGVAVPVAAGPGVVCGVKAAGLTRGDDEGPVRARRARRARRGTVVARAGRRWCAEHGCARLLLGQQCLLRLGDGALHGAGAQLREAGPTGGMSSSGRGRPARVTRAGRTAARRSPAGRTGAAGAARRPGAAACGRAESRAGPAAGAGTTLRGAEPEPDALAPVPPLPALVALVALLVGAVSSAISEAWSWASAARAARRLAWSAVGSMVASDCPADTWSPTLTLMPVTVPLVGKAAVTWSTRWAVPVRVRTWLTGPRLTVAVR